MNLALLESLNLGCSEIDGLFIKHYKLSDEVRLSKMAESFLALTKKRKVKTEKEAIEAAEAAETWTKKDEAKMQQTAMYLDRLQENFNKIIGPQKKDIANDIAETSERLIKMKIRRAEAIGRTAEMISSKLAHERFIVSLFFKDDNLSLQCVSPDEFEYMEEEELDKYFTKFGKFKKQTDDSELKKLACAPFCQNLYHIAGGGPSFFGQQSVLKLTVLQQAFIIYLENYKNIISNVAGKVEPEKLSDYEFLDNWASASERAREQLEGGGKKDRGASYEAIQRAATKKTDKIEDHVNNMKSII